MKRTGYVWWYFALAIGITWLFWVPGALDALGMLPFELPPPLLFFGAAGPIIAATILTWREGGGPALRRLYARLLQWRAGWRWYALGFVVPFALHYVPVGIGEALGLTDVGLSLPGPSLAATVPLALASMVIYSLEEVGWRGFALPRLQQSWSALKSSLVLGAFWTVWHVPLLASPDYYSGPGPWLVKLLALWAFISSMSVVWTWYFNSTGGSLLLANYLHLWVNLSFATLVLEVERPWVFELVLPAAAAVGLIGFLAWRFGADSLSSRPRVTHSALLEDHDKELAGL